MTWLANFVIAHGCETIGETAQSNSITLRYCSSGPSATSGEPTSIDYIDKHSVCTRATPTITAFVSLLALCRTHCCRSAVDHGTSGASASTSIPQLLDPDALLLWELERQLNDSGDTQTVVEAGLAGLMAPIVNANRVGGFCSLLALPRRHRN